jgi:hypothetical protein
MLKIELPYSCRPRVSPQGREATSRTVSHPPRHMNSAELASDPCRALLGDSFHPGPHKRTHYGCSIMKRCMEPDRQCIPGNVEFSLDILADVPGKQRTL